ncbi:dUTP diphosphatase [Hafnia alvei]|uniref:dUTP diphosphatase n=1 Tax=Hafnia alvei TaxID=569 RepID=UPI002DB7D538|nr:dUTP diphosphatase [Hafnia alvei]MEB7891861.1 dUTP diphosphatase [Hafnia alvei]
MTKQVPVSICITHPKAIIPSYISGGAAAFDLIATDVTLNTVVDSGDAHVAYFISTGLKVAIPEGYCMKIYPHPEIGGKHHARLASCVAIISSDERKEVQFKLVVDSGAKGFELKAGMCVAQGMIEEVVKAEFNSVPDSDFVNIGVVSTPKAKSGK